METITKRLKDLREDNDLTQEQIALLLKIKRAQYAKYERGEQPFPVRHLITLANFYKVSLDYITGRTENTKIQK